MNKIRAEITPQSNVILEPLSVKRSWMDNVTNAHAYHCFPVSLANGLGWGISFPEDISFIWDGIDTDKEEGHINVLSGHNYVNENRRSATLSLNTHVKFITDENTTILTMPVPNLFNENYQTFTSIISTSFFDQEFPSAIRILKPDKAITIKADEPFATLVPISLKDMSNIELNLNNFDMDEKWYKDNEERGNKAYELNKKGEWTNWYRNATDHNDISIGEHEVKSLKLTINDNRR